MPIRPYLDGYNFDPETVRRLGVAFEIVRAALRIDPSREASDAAVAAKLIECAELGMRDPEALSEHILALIGGPRPASPA